MNTIKKMLVCVLAVCFVLSAFSGCSIGGSTSRQARNNFDDASQTAQPDLPETDEALSADNTVDSNWIKEAVEEELPEDQPEDPLGKNHEDNRLVVATNASFPPYEYKQGGKIVGLDIDIVNEIARRVDCEVEIVDMEFDSILAAVQSGKCDIGIAGMTVTSEREQSVDFSRPYARDKQVVLAMDGIPYESYEDFYTASGDVQVGVRLGVVNGTTGDMYASADFGEDHIWRFESAEDAAATLLNGKLTAVILDEAQAKAIVRDEPGLAIQPKAYVEEEYAICVAKGNDRLLRTIDKVLANMESDGTLDRIVEKYY